MPWLGRGIRTIQMVSPPSALQARQWRGSLGPVRQRRPNTSGRNALPEMQEQQNGKTTRTGQPRPSQRQLRVGETVRKELSDILTRGRFSDPDLDGVIVTIPEVRMTPDLRLATCLVMPLGGVNAENVEKALNRSAKYLRGQVSRRLTMKYMPDLRFVLDTRFDDDDRIGTLLHSPEVSRDLDADEEDGDPTKD